MYVYVYLCKEKENTWGLGCTSNRFTLRFVINYQRCIKFSKIFCYGFNYDLFD